MLNFIKGIFARFTRSFWMARALRAERIAADTTRALTDQVFRELYITGIIDSHIGFKGEFAEYFVHAVGSMFYEGGAKNYVEVILTSCKTGERYALIFQRCAGLTPHEFRLQAERERDEALVRVAELEAAR